MSIDRSRLRNKHLKYPSREHFLNAKKMKNKCRLTLYQNISKEVQKKGFPQA